MQLISFGKIYMGLTLAITVSTDYDITIE